MAELDYAYLADFASIQEGKLTAVGASFTFVQVGELPLSMSLALIGRRAMKPKPALNALGITFA